MTLDPSNGWNQQMRALEGKADAFYVSGMAFAPHDGVTTDLNLFAADLLAGPNENVPDVMADWFPPA